MNNSGARLAKYFVPDYSFKKYHDVNQFVTISSTARHLILFYFILWRIIPEIATALKIDSDATEIIFLVTLARLVAELLFLFPLMIRRYAGTPIGWLHPLVLPTLLMIGNDLIRDPYSVFSPILVWLTPYQPPVEHFFIGNQSVEKLLEIDLKATFLLIVSQFSYYLGFALYSRRENPKISVKDYRYSRLRMIAIVVFCFLLFYLLVEKSGGVVEHFSNLAYGRARMARDVGHYLILINFLSYALIFWYLMEPRLISSLWFIAVFISSLSITFLATGSRSNLISPVLVLLAAWMLITHKVPTMRLVAVAIVTFLLLGVLGDLRSSAQKNQGLVDLSLFNQLSFSVAIDKTQEALEKNESVSGGLAVLQAVPDSVPWLYGSSYVGAALFFIPRSIWPDKPRGGGAHVGAIIYGGSSTTSGYLDTGYPIRAEIEAYWNFGVIGVIIIFAIFGLYQRFVTHLFLKTPHHPYIAVLFLMTLFELTGPSSDSIVPYAQLLVLLTLTYFFVFRTAHILVGNTMSVDGKTQR